MIFDYFVYLIAAQLHIPTTVNSSSLCSEMISVQCLLASFHAETLFFCCTIVLFVFLYFLRCSNSRTHSPFQPAPTTGPPSPRSARSSHASTRTSVWTSQWSSRRSSRTSTTCGSVSEVEVLFYVTQNVRHGVTSRAAGLISFLVWDWDK